MKRPLIETVDAEAFESADSRIQAKPKSGMTKAKAVTLDEDSGDEWGGFQSFDKALIQETEKAEAAEVVQVTEEPVDKPVVPTVGPEVALKADTSHQWSTFHKAKGYDWQGRSWVLCGVSTHGIRSRTWTSGSVVNRIPKKTKTTYAGHEKGVQAVRWFPRTGHLLLSASLDTSIRIWEADGKQSCMRTYHGHYNTVRDIQFADIRGMNFYSVAFDKTVLNWDTETGKIVTKIKHPDLPFCLCVHPNEPTRVLVGGSDCKIHEYDMRSGETVQVYDYHLNCVNALTVIDDGRKFVSSADDRKLFIWELGTPIVLKYISDPKQSSVPTLATHPGGAFFCGQSMDNVILTFEARGKFKEVRNRRFRGHLNSGFACEMSFSPDGEYICSGDQNGSLFIWNFSQGGRIEKTYSVHAQAAVTAAWHPTNATRIATGGWDSFVKVVE